MTRSPTTYPRSKAPLRPPRRPRHIDGPAAGWSQVVLVLVFLAVFAAGAPESLANPYVAKDTLGPVGFAKASTVTVYIEQDPFAKDPDNPADRVPSAQDGVLQWKDALKAIANIDLRVVKLDANGNDPATGNVPNYSQPGSVRLSWETPEQFKAAGHEGASAYATHASRDSDPPPGGKDGPRVNARLTTGGAVHLPDKGLGIAQASRDAALRATIHEFGHVLGMTHTKVVAAMNGDLMFQPFPGEVTEADKVELGAVYGLTAVQVRALVQPRQSSTATYYEYRYVAEYLSGDAGALFQIALDDATDVFDIQPPQGWIAMIAETFPIDEDVTPTIEPDLPGTVLTFRADALGSVVPYLSADNPRLEFGFSSWLAPVDTLAWAGYVQTVAGPRRIDEPTTAAIVPIAGLLALLMSRRSRSAARATSTARPHCA
jgi:hypothetical protein